jgi:hypothetical protein
LKNKYLTAIIILLIVLSIPLSYLISHLIKNYQNEKKEKIIEEYNIKITDAQINIKKYIEMNKNKINEINESKNYSDKEKKMKFDDVNDENKQLTDIYENSLDKKPSESDIKKLFDKSNEYLTKFKK